MLQGSFCEYQHFDRDYFPTIAATNLKTTFCKSIVRKRFLKPCPSAVLANCFPSKGQLSLPRVWLQKPVLKTTRKSTK